MSWRWEGKGSARGTDTHSDSDWLGNVVEFGILEERV